MNQRMMKMDGAYAKLGAKEFSLTTEENACKMNGIAKSFTNLDPTNCLYTAKYAENNGMAMRGHTLVWGAPKYHNPDFINNEKNATKLENFMNEYIETVMTKVTYPFAWDVINEAVANSGK